MHGVVQRSTSESGRCITLDGDELCARGSVFVRDIERKQTYEENVCVCDG